MQKSIIAKMDGVDGLKEAVKELEWWNDVPEENKNVFLEAKTTTEFRQALVDLGVWDQVPDELKKRFSIDDKDFTKKVQDDNILLEKFDSFDPDPVRFLANNADLLQKVRDGENKIVLFNGQKVDLKKLYGENKDLVNSLAIGSDKILEYNRKEAEWKRLRAENKDLISKLAYGQLKIRDWNALSLPKKQALITTNAADVRNLLQSARNEWEKMLNTRHEKIIKIAYKTSGKAPSGVQEVGGYAKGTDFHKGGLAMVNDASGSKFRELITTPSGHSFIPEGRNILINLPRGSSVLRGDRTEKLMRAIPRFAQGTKRAVSPIFSNSVLMRALSRALTGNKINKAGGDSRSSGNDRELLTRLQESNKQQGQMIELLKLLVSKELIVDKKALEQSTTRLQTDQLDSFLFSKGDYV